MRIPPKAGESGQKRGPLQAVLNVLGVLLCVIFIPVIIINVTMIVRSYTAPDEMPSVFGYSPVIVLSGSMSPEFEAGDMILLRKTDTATLKVGDVICFREEETAVTHRIMEIQEQDGEKLFITMGDANGIEDMAPVRESQVQGKYTGARFAGVGQFAMFLQSTPGMLIFIGGPVVLFILWDLLRRMLANKKIKAETSGRQEEMEAMAQELERLRAQVNTGQQEQAPPPQGPQGP